MVAISSSPEYDFVIARVSRIHRKRCGSEQVSQTSRPQGKSELHSWRCEGHSSSVDGGIVTNCLTRGKMLLNLVLYVWRRSSLSWTDELGAMVLSFDLVMTVSSGDGSRTISDVAVRRSQVARSSRYLGWIEVRLVGASQGGGQTRRYAGARWPLLWFNCVNSAGFAYGELRESEGYRHPAVTQVE